MKNQESKMEFGSDLKALYPDFMDVLNHVFWSQNLCLDYMMSSHKHSPLALRKS
jgi:hypothetical protein